MDRRTTASRGGAQQRGAPPLPPPQPRADQRGGRGLRAASSGDGAHAHSVKWQRFVLMLVLFVAFLYVVVTSALSVYYAGQVVRPAKSPYVPIRANIEFGYETASFKSADDLTSLYGWRFTPAKKAVGIVVLVHGFGEQRFPFGMDTFRLVRAYGGLGYDVLAFDLRNSGASADGLSTFGIQEAYDVRGAVAYAKALGYKRVVLHGFSTGANAAVMGAAALPPGDVGALVLDSPIADMGDYALRKVRERVPGLPDFPFRYMLPAMVGLYTNGDLASADISSCLEGVVPRPVLLIHGDDDGVVSTAAADAVYDAYMELAVGKISMWNVDGAGHEGAFLHDEEGYVARLGSFLERVFE